MANSTLQQNSTSSGILLKNGLIADGTGRKPYPGHLLIKDGKIDEISSGNIETPAEVIDCSGNVIAPGFIDVHSHNDWRLPIIGRDDLKQPFVAQGITTFIGGNCGFAPAGFKKNTVYRDRIADNFFKTDLFHPDLDSMEDYFTRLEQNGLSHNLAMLAGHGSTRTSIRGFDPSPLAGDEMKEMLYLLEEALDQGARGVSFGLQYEPGIFATSEEIESVAELLKSKNKILAVHLKAYTTYSPAYPFRPFSEPHNILALSEMIDVAGKTGVRLQVSHLIFVGKKTWKSCQRAVDLIGQAVDRGVDVGFDIISYHCGVGPISVLLPKWFLENFPETMSSKNALLKLRFQIYAMEKLLGIGYDDIQIVDMPDSRLAQYNGLSASEIARRRGMKPFDNLMDIVGKTSGLARVMLHQYNNSEINEILIKSPVSLFMTDAWMELSGIQNPHCYGALPRLLQLIREKNLIPLEEAVYKMTGAAAERFGLSDRGVLENGKAADITVMKWDEIQDNNSPGSEYLPPSGIRHVFINGKLVFYNGKINGPLDSGAVLR